MEYAQIVIWVGVLSALSALALPITNVVFARLPGRGAGFAPTIALGIVSMVAFWVGHVRFGPVALAGGLLVLCAGAVIALNGDVDPDWRAFGEAMVVFVVSFGFMIAIRAVDPGILVFTEAFYNYGMVQSLLRAPRLPPEDFWFAGASVRYHYGGHLVVALQTMLTGTRPPVAFNLAMAGFFAMLVTGAYELAGAIGAARGRSRNVSGLLGAYFVGFSGNLLVPVTVTIRNLPDAVRRRIASAIGGDLGAQPAEILETGMRSFDYGDVYLMIPNALTPFPLFVWIHGELHAHMNSAPFLLLAAAVSYAYYRTPARERTARRLLAFVAFPLAAGFSLVASVWTGPTLIGLMVLVIAFAPAPPSTLLPEPVRVGVSAFQPSDDSPVFRELWRFGLALAVSVVIAALVVAASAPFSIFVSGGGTESIALVRGTNRTGIFALLLVHGGYLALFAPYLTGPVRTRIAESPTQIYAALTAGTSLLVVVTLLNYAPALLLFVPILAAGWYVLRSDPRRFETVFVIAGSGLLLLVEFVYVSNQEYVIPGRGNTVFRTYWHSWILWGVAAGVVLPRLVRPADVSWLRLPRRRPIRTAFALGVFLSTAAYGGVTVFEHFDGAYEESDEWNRQSYVHEALERDVGSTPPTLDGMLWVDVRRPSEADAARWLNRNVDGTPTIVTAPGGRWETRSVATALTGLPTVAGWAHQLVYREWDAYYERVEDVRTIYYGPPDDRVDLLSKYDVRYVYVGPDERQRYDVWEFSLLDGVSVVYENEKVVIYEVDQAALGYSPRRVDSRQFPAEDLTRKEAVASYRGDDVVAPAGSGAS